MGETRGRDKSNLHEQDLVLAMKTELSQANQFAVCLNNEGYEVSLEIGKIYRTIPDEAAETNGLMRVIDESGEDYAFAFLSQMKKNYVTSFDISITNLRTLAFLQAICVPDAQSQNHL